jgi:hypothetical protein
MLNKNKYVILLILLLKKLSRYSRQCECIGKGKAIPVTGREGP